MLLTRFTPILKLLLKLFKSRSVALSAAVGIVLAGPVLGGCTATQVSPETASEAPVQLPSFHLSSRPATAIDSLSDAQVDETITVSGKIAQKSAVLEGWIYQVQDETGSLWVLTDRDVPEVGESVTVEGAIRYEPIVVGEIDASEFYLEEKSYQQPQDRPADS